jgi:hypothetical protein
MVVKNWHPAIHIRFGVGLAYNPSRSSTEPACCQVSSTYPHTEKNSDISCVKYQKIRQEKNHPNDGSDASYAVT